MQVMYFSGVFFHTANDCPDDNTITVKSGHDVLRSVCERQ